MADVHPWERSFVERFICNERRDRYLTFLKSRKHRGKLLDRLNHSLDYDPALAKELPSGSRTDAGLTTVLRSLHVADTCHLVADGNEFDGRELRLERGVAELLANFLGAVLICPPKPIAVYKEEDPGRLLLLSEESCSNGNHTAIGVDLAVRG